MNTRKQNDTMSKHILLTVAALLVAGLFLAGCSNEPIFAAIEKEVKLKDPSVRGTITSLVTVGSDLYVTNGRIYKRTGGSGDWNQISMPDYRCTEVATDGTDLYGLFQDEHYDITDVYRFDGTIWTAVTDVAGIKKISSGDGQVFGFTGSGSSWNAYTITGTTASAIGAATGIALPVGSAGDCFATTTGVYNIVGTLLTGSPTASITGITAGGANIFVLTSAGTVYPFVGGTALGPTETATVSTPATGIAYLAGTKKLLLVSGAEGYGEITTDGSGVLTGTLSPGDSSASSISTSAQSQYESSLDQWNLHSIFAVAAPGPVPAGDSYVVYAGVYDTRYDGLWGYYSTSQQEWNRE